MELLQIEEDEQRNKEDERRRHEEQHRRAKEAKQKKKEEKRKKLKEEEIERLRIERGLLAEAERKRLIAEQKEREEVMGTAMYHTTGVMPAYLIDIAKSN